MAVPVILPLAGAVAFVAALVAWAANKGDEDSGTSDDNGGGGGGGTTKPKTTTKKPKTTGTKKPPASAPKQQPKPEDKFKRGPGGIGWVFGDGDIPDDFEWSGNGIFVSENCDTVAVGRMFWPGPEDLPPKQGPTAIEAETLEQALAINGNTALGFVDFLLVQEGLEQPEEVGARIVAEATPWCWEMLADTPAAQWPDGLANYYEWLQIRLIPYVDEWVHGIDFGGES